MLLLLLGLGFGLGRKFFGRFRRRLLPEAVSRPPLPLLLSDFRLATLEKNKFKSYNYSNAASTSAYSKLWEEQAIELHNGLLGRLQVRVVSFSQDMGKISDV